MPERDGLPQRISRHLIEYPLRAVGGTGAAQARQQKEPLLHGGLHPLAIGLRIRDEEELLTRELSGYREYTEQVRYRLLPYLW